MSEDKQLDELRKLLDPKRWPKYDALIDGEIFRFVTDHPLEERVCKVLYQ